MTPEEIEALFTRESGEYFFARWGRPVVPIVFGVEDETLSTIKGAFDAVLSLAGHKMSETDSELGANCMMFFFRDWQELLEVPDLDRLIPDLSPLVERLIAAEANQYRIFRFEEDGAIRAAFLFLRMDTEMSRVSADTLALSQVVQTILLWSDATFRNTSPLAIVGDATILRPDIAALIRAAYDSVLPGAAQDPSHALRLFAGFERPQ